jgi:D-alanyl-D-alanine carboxypeptidase (penicillin-binding protein 5/6)
MGDRKTVDLGITQDVSLTIPRGQSKNLKANFIIDRQLQAPLKKGEVVGVLSLQIENETIADYPLVALQDVNEGSMFDKALDYFRLQFSDDTTN